MTRFLAIAAGAILTWGAVVCLAEEPTALERGWTEFQFQMFDEAEVLFEKAEGDEALIGQAMTLQFREKNPAPEKAVEIYRSILAKEPAANVALLAESLLAEALWETGESEEADELWHNVITSHSDHIVAQDALLRRTVAHVGDLTSEQTQNAITYAEARRAELTPPTVERPGLFPTIDNMLSSLHFWRGEYAEARECLVRAVEIGSLDTTSPVVRGNMIMQIARISEKFLDDPKTAGRYYRQLVLELPTDVRSYYAMEQAVGYGTLSRAEIEGMDLNGLTAERIDQIMAKGKN